MKRTIELSLQEWKGRRHRLPLILRGARQVGKSFVIEKFGRESFADLAVVNFEFRPELTRCFESLDPRIICSRLEVFLKQRIVPGSTLLFLDEIQACPQAIHALRYFKEQLPELHVIGAGSLLEFILHEEQFSFPVGRVEFMYLKPLSFWEYLLAQEEEGLLAVLEGVSVEGGVDPLIHGHLLALVKEYCLIGGMPAVVESFVANRSFVECQRIQTNLLETYRADFSKYAQGSQFKYLQAAFSRVPGLVGMHFKYIHINPEMRSRDLKIALDQLSWAGLIHRVYVTSGAGLPLETHVKLDRFKLLFLDIGLMNCANRLDLRSAWEDSLHPLNAGALTEQFVGQELLAYAESGRQAQLYYWQRDKVGSDAEVDYLLQVGSSIVPVEVKSGSTGRLRSLALFLQERGSPFGVRISQHPLSLHNKILSVPLYLVNRLSSLLGLGL